MDTDIFELKIPQADVLRISRLKNDTLNNWIKLGQIKLENDPRLGKGAKRLFRINDVLHICTMAQLTQLGIKPGMSGLVSGEIAFAISHHFQDRLGVYGERFKTAALAHYAIVYFEYGQNSLEWKPSDTPEFDFIGRNNREVPDATWAVIDLHKLKDGVLSGLEGVAP